MGFLTDIPTGKGWLGLLLMPLLIACSGIQIDSAPLDRFNEGGYQSYSWRTAALETHSGDTDTLSIIDPALRTAVNDVLSTKGYRQVASGGDFVIDYQFRAALAQGELNSTAREAENTSPYVDPNVVINRQVNQALLDNAYALSGPKAINSIVIQFSSGEKQRLIWTTSINKIVENVNRDNMDKMTAGINKAISRAFARLPRAGA